MTSLAIFAILSGVLTAGDADNAPRVVAVATLAGGESRSGNVSKAPEKAAILQIDEQHQTILSEVVELRFQPTGAPISAPRLTFHWAVHESLPGAPVAMTESFCEFLTPFGRVKIPPARMLEIRSDHRGQVIMEDRFQDLARWQTTDRLNIARDRWVSPPGSLRLEAGQTAALKVPKATASGRIEFWFYDEGPQSRHSQGIARLYADDDGVLLTLPLIGSQPYYTVQVAERLNIAALAVARSQGWHHAVIDFGPQWLLATVDGAAICWSPHQGLGTTAAKPARLDFHVTPGQDSPSARLWIDDLRWIDVAGLSPFATLPSSPAISSPEQTQIITAKGNEWHGQFHDANEDHLGLKVTADHTEKISWKDIQLVRFPIPTRTQPIQWEGEIGTLVLRTGDSFIAQLVEADSGRWVVRHPLFDSLTIPLEWIDRWVPRIAGQRTELIPGIVHAGNRVVPEFRIPTPAGNTVNVEFENHRRAETTYLSLWIRGMEAQTPRSTFGHVVRKGGLRTEVFLNDVKVDYLNQHLQGTGEFEEVRLPLPQDNLRPGRNQLQLRLVADPQTGAYDESELASIAIEQSFIEGKTTADE